MTARNVAGSKTWIFIGIYYLNTSQIPRSFNQVYSMINISSIYDQVFSYKNITWSIVDQYQGHHMAPLITNKLRSDQKQFIFMTMVLKSSHPGWSTTVFIYIWFRYVDIILKQSNPHLRKIGKRNDTNYRLPTKLGQIIRRNMWQFRGYTDIQCSLHT